MMTSNKLAFFTYWIFVFTCLLLFCSSLMSFIEDQQRLSSLQARPLPIVEKIDHQKAELLVLINKIKKSSYSNVNDDIQEALRLDPDNGYIDALAIKNLSDDIGYDQTDKENKTENINITNEDSLRKAIQHFQNILKKQTYNSYHLDIYNAKSISIDGSYITMLEDIATSFDYYSSGELRALNFICKAYLLLDDPNDEDLLKRAIDVKLLGDKLIYNSGTLLEALNGCSINHFVHTHLKNTKKDNEQFLPLLNSLSYYQRWKPSLLDPEHKMEAHHYELSEIAKRTVTSFYIPKNLSELLRSNRLLEYTFYESVALYITLIIIVISVIALSLVLFRWRLRNEGQVHGTLYSKKAILSALAITALTSILYLTFRNYLGSREIGAMTGMNTGSFIGEFLSIFLISTTLPLKLIFDHFIKENESTIELPTRRYSNYLIFTPLLLMPICSFAPIPQKVYALSFLTLAVCAYPFCYVCIYFRMLITKKHCNWSQVLAKTTIIYLCFYGLILFVIYKPIIKESEQAFYDSEIITRVATNLGYATLYTEAKALEELKAVHMKDLSKLPPIPDETKHKKANNYRLSLKFLNNPKTPSDFLEENKDSITDAKSIEGTEGRRSRRGRILKARKEAMEKSERSAKQSEDKTTE